MKKILLLNLFIILIGISFVSAEPFCIGGDTRYYTCPDGTEVYWCTCDEEAKQFTCINSPENACLEDSKFNYTYYIIGAIILIILIGLFLRKRKN